MNLLAPIGQHRSTHITPSKGKRSKKRKRQEARKGDEPHHQAPAPPPPPALTRHITVGVNSTTRYLEQLAANKAPPTHAAAPEQADRSKPHAAAPGIETDAPHSPESLRHLPLIFTLQPPSSITTSHLPLLTHTASRLLPSFKLARLVPLKPSSEPKLAAALGVPRVGVIGIMEDAPGAEPLIKYAREKVSATDVPWLREASEGRYLGVNVLTEQPGTKTGSKK
ncbi:RNase P and RNase MRP subunit [Neofusicoccum ribis]|uniref:RNase P and RNase MRP subunit n=1 Tax=Neofusicoccum ribis TaxID=45134 RepID=A0ABR3SMY5_9PEZI